MPDAQQSPVTPHLNDIPFSDQRTALSWRRRKRQPPFVYDHRLSQIDLALQLVDVVICAYMFDQALHVAAYGIHVSVPAADHARVLAIGCMAFDRKSLPEPELARLHDVGLVTLLHHCDRSAFPNHPEVITGHVEP